MVKYVVRVCLIVFSFITINAVQAKEQQAIRFYKANKDLQTDLIRFTRSKAQKPGCHNFLKKTRVFKVVQFGFKTCSLYAKKDCVAESIISVGHKKVDTVNTLLTPGYGWLPESDKPRGARIRSWSCQ